MKIGKDLKRPEQTRRIEEAAWCKYNHTWKNNRGKTKTQSGQWLSYGLPPPPNGRKKDKLKGGDRIGFHKVKITPDMVGKTIAVFISIEIKSDGDTLKQGQIDWHNLVLNNGGISEIWYSDRIVKEMI